jgi:catechol 2,3-dioxygenase-like lactoylglutathione lyase family enzyme
VDERLEAVVIPVSAADRAKEFYGRLGWRLDAPPREHRAAALAAHGPRAATELG